MKTVKDLITELMEYDPEAPVFMKSDPEGNSTHAFDEASLVPFHESPHYGFQEFDPDDYEPEYGDIKAVVLWPGYGAQFDE